MNKDIVGLNNIHDPEYPEMDHELRKLREHELKRHHDVGSVNVPRKKGGRGGSYGDLPRDYDIFTKKIDEKVTNDFDKFGPRPPNGSIYPDDLNDLEYPMDSNNISYQQKDLKRRKNIVNSRNAQENMEHMNNDAGHMNHDVEHMNHDAGQMHDNMGDNMGQMGDISGMDADTSVEDDGGIEQYAPVEHDEQDEYDNNDNKNDNCSSCSDNKIVYGGKCEKDYEYLDNGHEEENPQFDDNYDYEYEYDYEDDEDNIESYENEDDLESDENNYSVYVFFIIIFLICIAFYYYLNNNDRDTLLIL
jgi:hypothetical protein